MQARALLAADELERARTVLREASTIREQHSADIEPQFHEELDGLLEDAATR